MESEINQTIPSPLPKKAKIGKKRRKKSPHKITKSQTLPRHITHYLNTSDDYCPLGIEETNEREAEALKCLKDLSDGENPRNISFEKNFKDFALPKTPILPGKKLKGPKHSSLPLTPTQPDEKSMTFEAVAALLLSPKGLFSSLQNTAESFDEKIKKESNNETADQEQKKRLWRIKGLIKDEIQDLPSKTEEEPKKVQKGIYSIGITLPKKASTQRINEQFTKGFNRLPILAKMGFSANTILKKIEDSMPKDYLHKKKSLEKINSKINGRSLSVPKLEQSINANNMNNYYHFDEPRYGYRDISRTFRRTEESIEKTQDASKTGRVSEKESPRRATSKSFLSQKSLTSRKSHIELHEITPENRWKVTPKIEKSGRNDNQNEIVSAFRDVIEVKFGRGVKGIVRRTKSTPKLSMKLNKSSNIAVTSKEEENNKRKDSEKLTPKNIQSMRLPKFMTKVNTNKFEVEVHGKRAPIVPFTRDIKEEKKRITTKEDLTKSDVLPQQNENLNIQKPVRAASISVDTTQAHTDSSIKHMNLPTIKQTLKHRPKIIARNVDKDKSFLNISATRRLQLDTSSNQQNISKEFNDVNLADNSTLHSSNQVDPSFLGRKNQINFHKKEEDKFKLKGYSMYFNNIKMGPLMPQSYYRDGGGNL